ncbi:hypothetical protein SAMN05428985_11067 [Nocardioides sp. YR527]|uniref:hypothetical protein n=1 Tax=Nocardioides sp. YR527 TaxID=1881028 RepID=UPI0008914DC3|nr:hypothetical protein [Nocardioides sp. YR527]SDL15012.1 hypothetical protein SAMN05428985_11067 [Nocardioides sp. YR527]
MGEQTRTERRTKKHTAMIDQFNELCPIGSPVVFWPGVRDGEGRKSTTRSVAWLLGDHTPVVMVEGYPGGIALANVMPYAPHPKQAKRAAWEEGVRAAHRSNLTLFAIKQVNPYRTEEKADD